MDRKVHTVGLRTNDRKRSTTPARRLYTRDGESLVEKGANAQAARMTRRSVSSI